jgi:hypothetical protein
MDSFFLGTAFHILKALFKLYNAISKRLFKSKDTTPPPRILANSATLSTFPTRTDSNLAKFVFKPDTASKH